MHEFVVPAYGASPYLAACLDSLLAQEGAGTSKVRIATSTPCPEVVDACRDRGIELATHAPNRGIGADWNFALGLRAGGLVTLAHQDDVYMADYAKRVRAMHLRHPDAGFYFSDSHEIDPGGKRRPVSRALAVKRALAKAAFLGSERVESKSRRRMLLGLGNSIPCPTVTLNLDVLGGFRFREDLRTNMDWFAWLQAARKAPVCYIPCDLVGHRVHGGSETSRCIEDGSRRLEDEMIFREFWPAPLVSILSRLYTLGYEAHPR